MAMAKIIRYLRMFLLASVFAMCECVPTHSATTAQGETDMTSIDKELSAAKLAEAKAYRALMDDPRVIADPTAAHTPELLKAWDDACAAEFAVRQRIEDLERATADAPPRIKLHGRIGGFQD